MMHLEGGSDQALRCHLRHNRFIGITCDIVTVSRKLILRITNPKFDSIAQKRKRHLLEGGYDESRQRWHLEGACKSADEQLKA